MIDDDVLTAFEACALPLKEWDHLAHIRVALLYLSRLELAEAINRMRSGIRAYNSVHGVHDGTERGYHETTTQAFMRLIHQAMRQRGPFQDSRDFCRRSPELLDRRVLLCYYTRDRMLHPAAKDSFVEPDIASLDCIGLTFPEFGDRVEGVSYAVRPSTYGLITDEAGRIAAVTTASGVHLPGGRQEAGESAIDALRRQVLNECDLAVMVKRPIGTADEIMFADHERRHYCMRCSFYSAIVAAIGSSTEPHSRLDWLAPDEAAVLLTRDSHRWAASFQVP